MRAQVFIRRHVIASAARQSADFRRFNSGLEIIILRQSLSEKVPDTNGMKLSHFFAPVTEF
jgi:hypothetical protein